MESIVYLKDKHNIAKIYDYLQFSQLWDYPCYQCQDIKYASCHITKFSVLVNIIFNDDTKCSPRFISLVAWKSLQLTVETETAQEDVLRGGIGGSQRLYPTAKEKRINSENYSLREAYNITKHYFAECQREGKANIPYKEFEFPPFYQIKEYYSLSVSEEAGFVQIILRTDENNIKCGMEIKDFRRIEKIFESAYEDSLVKKKEPTLGESIKKYEETLRPIDKPKRPLPFTGSKRKVKKKKANNNTMSKNIILWKMKYANPEKYETLALELLNMLNLPQEEKTNEH